MKIRSGQNAARKRPLSDTAHALPPTQCLRLTTQNLRIHNGMPRKKLRSSATSSTGTVTTTSSNFAAHLRQHQVVTEPYEVQQATDHERVRQSLDAPRESASPEVRSWKDFCKRIKNCDNEDDVKNEGWCGTSECLAKKPSAGAYHADHNKSWNRAADETKIFGAHISAPKPDYSECFRISEYSLEAVTALGASLVPTTGNSSTMPTFAAEIKSRKVSLLQATQQAAFDGCYMTAADIKISLCTNEPTELGMTRAMTVAFNGDNVAIYGNHQIQTAAGPEYHASELFHHRPTSSLSEYKASRRHVRNAQEWSRRRAELRRDRLRAQQYLPSPPPTSVAAPKPSGSIDIPRSNRGG